VLRPRRPPTPQHDVQRRGTVPESYSGSVIGDYLVWLGAPPPTRDNGDRQHPQYSNEDCASQASRRLHGEARLHMMGEPKEDGSACAAQPVLAARPAIPGKCKRRVGQAQSGQHTRCNSPWRADLRRIGYLSGHPRVAILPRRSSPAPQPSAGSHISGLPDLPRKFDVDLPTGGSRHCRPIRRRSGGYACRRRISRLCN
jgi:hypothetical protein